MKWVWKPIRPLLSDLWSKSVLLQELCLYAWSGSASDWNCVWKVRVENVPFLQKHAETLFVYNQALRRKCKGQLFLWATHELGVFLPPFSLKSVRLRLHTTVWVKNQSSIIWKIRAFLALGVHRQMHDN